MNLLKNLILFLVFYFLCSLIPTTWVEHYYLPYVFKPYGQIIRAIFQYIPYWLVVLFIGGVVIYTFKKHWPYIYLFYMLTWGMVYKRESLENRLHLKVKQITQADIYAFTDSTISRANLIRPQLKLDTVPQFNQIIQSSIQPNQDNSKVKVSPFGSFLFKINTSGYFSFPTAQAQINALIGDFDVPFVVNHEFAHLKGTASEEEANYWAYHACVKHPNPKFKYSAYYQIIGYGINAVAQTDTILAKQLIDKLHPLIIQDRKYDRHLAQKYGSPWMGKISFYIYDLFLKSNGQKDGTVSYSKVLELLISESH